MTDGTFRRDVRFLDRHRLAQHDSLRGFLPEPPPPATEAGTLAGALLNPSPATAGAGSGEVPRETVP